MYSFGIDLGGTNIAVGLVDVNGKIIFKNSIPTLPYRNHKLILKDMAMQCLEILKKCNVTLSHVNSIGIGSPGKCLPDKKIIVYSCNFSDFHNTEIETEIRKYLDLPVYLENDANCAALAENICGAAKNFSNSITVTLGTGIGGGIITDGKIMAGSGEIGHHVIISNGKKCACGRKGCWETYASATALIKQAKKNSELEPNSKLNTENKITAKFVFDIANENDTIAKKIVDEYIFYLSEGLANLINIFQPEIIVVGGGISEQGEKIIQPLREKLNMQVYGGKLETKIVQAKLGNDAGIIGAAFLCSEKTKYC